MRRDPFQPILRKLAEPLLMSVTLVEWLLLGSGVGALVGVAVTFFLRLLLGSIDVTSRWPTAWFALVLPLGGLVAGLAIHYGAPDAAGHGTEAVIRAVHRRSGRIDWKVAPIKALASVATMAAGGSAGKEGPSAQIGASIASALADLLHFSPAYRKKIVICGIGAGFAAVFGTPIAGAVLGIEVLAIGEIMYEMLVPSFASAFVAYWTAHALGLTWPYPTFAWSLPLSLPLFIRFVVLGVLAGLVGLLFVQLLYGINRFTAGLKRRRHIWPPLFPTAAGVVLFAFVLLAGRSYMNLSLPLLYHALGGQAVAGDAFLWKIVFVSVTLGAGMSGGIITPLFVVGATFGAVAAGPLGLPSALGAEAGMVAVTAAGANAPLAAIMLGVELFGVGPSAYFMAAAIPAFIIIGNHSVYPSQRLALQKSPLVPVQVGGYLEDTEELPLALPFAGSVSRVRALLARFASPLARGEQSSLRGVEGAERVGPEARPAKGAEPDGASRHRGMGDRRKP